MKHRRNSLNRFRSWRVIIWLGVLLIIISTGSTYALIQIGNWQHTQSFLSSGYKQIETERERQLEKADNNASVARKEAQTKADKAKQAAESARSSVQTSSSDCNTSSSHNDPTKIDVLVNKKHCIVPLTFAPTDLRTSNGATLADQASRAFDQLFAAAQLAGFTIGVTSSYRSYNDQVTTYNYWVGVSGRDGADTYSARPGYSEHQTGLALDVSESGCSLSCFGSTSLYTWLQQNAAEYGFIQRYYSGYESVTGYTAEEWHYRYVGRDTAQLMKQKNVKTLEEFWTMNGGTY